MNEGNMLMEDIIIMLGIAFNLNLPYGMVARPLAG